MDAPVAWVISHDLDMRRLIELNLERRGFCTVEITTPSEPGAPAIRPHMIILDIDPAVGPDWETARTLRQTPGFQAVPLLFITPTLPAASQLIALEPFFWVRKPLAMGDLLALMCDLVSHWR